MGRRNTVSVIITIVTVCVGALLGATVQDLVIGSFSLLIALVAVLCLTLVAVLAAATAERRATVDNNKNVRTVVKESTDNQAMALENLGKILELSTVTLTDGLDQLGQRLGVQVSYQKISEVNTLESAQGDLVVRAVQRAHEEILILDGIPSSGKMPDRVVRPDLMASLLEIILQRAAAGVKYRRICQVTDPAAPFATLRDNMFLEHYRKMAQSANSDNPAILKVTPLRYPYKFLVIDRAIVILQLHTVDEPDAGDHDRRIWCEIIFVDPNKELVNIFMDMWNDINDDAQTRRIRLYDFR